MLYYPCSGQDFSQPIRTFANDVDTFWFADTSYLHRFPSGVERGRLQLPPIFEVVGHSKQNLQLPNENEAPAIQIQWQHRRSERLIDAWFLSMDEQPEQVGTPALRWRLRLIELTAAGSSRYYERDSQGAADER
jgi:hypothetical protein